MSDQGFFQKSINAAGAASQAMTATGNINGSATVVAATLAAIPATLSLPDQLGAAGQTITVSNVDGTAVLTVGVQLGDSMNGLVDGSAALAAVAFTTGIFTCLGSAGWVQVV